MWLQFMISILTKDSDLKIANLYFKKIHYTVLNKYGIFEYQTQVYEFFW